MSIEIGDNGRRSVQVEVEVPGTPEQVWQAIATGPGISSWFVPTAVEEREGGTTTSDYGAGMETSATLTRWDPPRSFVKEGDGMGPDAPPVATEWIVEAKSGGKCVVRVVHSWFASTDEWDAQWESVQEGWSSFFILLRLKLEHFADQPCASFAPTGMATGSESEVWAGLTAPFGLSDAAVGQEVQGGPPALSGRVVALGPWEARELMLLISEPAPGVCHFFAVPMGEQVYLSVRFFLFGDGAEIAAAKAEPEWQEWFTESFSI